MKPDEDLAKFKEVNPEGYEALMSQIDKTKEGTAKLAEDIKSSTNPCLGSASVAQAATGCVIKQPHIDSSKPVTNLTTPEAGAIEFNGKEEFTGEKPFIFGDRANNLTILEFADA